MDNSDWAQLQDVVAEAGFPATRQDVISCARDRNSSAVVLDVLYTLPDVTYRSRLELRGRLPGAPDTGR
jgi:hypothetical protein